MTPSGVALTKTYLFGEEIESKAADWGEQLWLILKQLLPVSPPISLRASDSYAYLGDRLTNFVHSRLIVRGVQLVGEFNDLPGEALDQELDNLVDDLLDLSAEERANIVWFLRRACERIRAGGADPTKSQKKTIRRFAQANSHRCYLCGHSLIFGNEAEAEEELPDDALPEQRAPQNYWTFEIEHVFPQRRGGSRHRSNLAASCKSCNKFKDVLISFADLPVETYVTPSITPSRITETFGGVKKFALLWRQRGCCARCDVPFYEAADERLFIVRGDPKDAYHFFNVEIACGPCGDEIEEGILLRA
ncbi:MAG: HNH endonuclease [Brevundimonas sp.]|uniref:HNH endonuclease n=1 Tax=Brevundimonas sp. TaxID=1871086 RepID=UPI001A2BE6B4|nr:HNH endonuclease [Brevundimonas sp.]MBJ7446240.1 HNH endonuclease [Brevundimonas sp.]